MRMEVSSNWFKLTDPEHLIFHTKRMLERGREVQELRRAIVDACSLEQYRVADLNVLQAKLSQLEAMLPSQSKVIQLPYENTACGFDLYTDGAAALVPELSGYEGIDIITKPAAGTSPFLADIFIYGKYIDLLDTKVIVGGSYLPQATIATATTGGFEILSREVVHAQIPLTAQPTVTFDNKTYLEVYLATPTGISNRLLVPYQAAAAAPQVAFDLSPDTPELDVYYQWWPKADPTATLVATSDPGAGALKIKWDASTGMAPKTLQANFSATILGQSLSFSLEANSGVQDEYVVNTQLLTVMLLKRLQGLFPAPTPLPAQISMKISVQPYLPQNSMGYRVLSKAKDLNTPLTVKLFYNANGTNALKGIIEQPPAPAAAPAAKKAAARDMGEPNDDPVRRVSLTEADLGALSRVPGELQPQLNALFTSPVPPAAGELAGSLSQAASSAVSTAQDSREQPGISGRERDPEPRSGTGHGVATAPVHRCAFLAGHCRRSDNGDAPQVAWSCPACSIAIAATRPRRAGPRVDTMRNRSSPFAQLRPCGLLRRLRGRCSRRHSVPARQYSASSRRPPAAV